MIYYENDCVDCRFPCIFESCPYWKVKHYICDFCKAEDVKLYKYDGYEICEDCLLKEFPIVEGSDEW